MKAFISGVNGQDGAWLARLLLDKNYDVYGMVRRSSTDKLWRLRYLNVLENSAFHIVSGDITDQTSLNRLIKEIQPDECYNLAAQSFVAESFHSPVSTCDITGMGVLHLLEAIRMHSPKTKIYQAGSSEQFGTAHENQKASWLDESSHFSPRSPYAAAKIFAHNMVKVYRESYGIFGCVGLLFNHESELRGEEFVTTKVCKAAAEIAAGKRDSLALGNLEAYRDWGYAPDYVKGMWLMLQQAKCDDYVLATHKVNSIRDLCEAAFMHFGRLWEDYVVTDPQFNRPSDVPYLLGSPYKAKNVLGWEPTVTFDDMIDRMCNFWSKRV